MLKASLWKIVMGIVSIYGVIRSNNSRRGTLINIPRSKYLNNAKATMMRQQSLTVHGGNMFNLVLYQLRNWSGSIDGFKIKLDDFLSKILYHPITQDLTQEPINKLSTKNSNAIFDCMLFLS